MTPTDVYYHPRFARQLKKATKKHPSMIDDVDRLIKVRSKMGRLPGEEVISRLGQNYSGFRVMKVKHFRCASMQNSGSRSGYRLIYLEYAEDLFVIDLYHHNERDMHDVDLIRSSLDVLISGDWASVFIKQPAETCGFLLERGNFED